MRCWLSRALAGSVVGFLLLAPIWGDSIATAQVRFVNTAEVASHIDDALAKGATLEQDRRWGEALTHYEESLRKFPGEAQLQQRFTRSKLHYDLARRYNDTSFRKALETMPEADALALYAEVLLKIQSHYVDQPGWQALVDRGTVSLEAALEDPIFIEQHLSRVSPQAIERTRSQLRTRFAAWPMADRHQARQAVERIARTFQHELGLAPTATIFEYTCGATGALDDYSAYLTADQLDEVYSQIDGNFVGLGIELKSADDALLIVKVIPQSPAERSGLRAGDCIIAVGGRTTSEMTTDAAANLLQGPEGTTVELAVQSPGQPARRMTVRREHVEIPSVVEDRIVDPAMGIAYLKLTCFQKTTARDLDAALWRLHRAGMKSLIMDLRGNPGGLLTSAVEIV
ncbi:MAG: PDZ domain-containing protein, partial [Planctomycetaceae bacterium]|nr:PDZ domain-containing protein [Planctomycetaceae bacterium]